MSKKKHCREVKKLIRAMPECTPEQIGRSVSEHLSECEACKNLHAALQKVEAGLIGSKLQVDEMAHQSWIGKRQALIEMAPRGKRSPWRAPKAVANRPRTETARSERGLSAQRPGRRRLAWAMGAVGLCLFVSSCLLSVVLWKKVEVLTKELQVARRDAVVAREKEHSESAEEAEQRAIRAVYLRMGELMERRDRFDIPQTAFLPSEGGNPFTVLAGDGFPL
jgi:hypothetical protein